MSSILLDVEVRESDFLFDSNVVAVSSPMPDKSFQSQDSCNSAVKDFSAVSHVSYDLLSTPKGHLDNQQYGNKNYGRGMGT